MDQLLELIKSFYDSICAMFISGGYGDPVDSQNGDINIPIIAPNIPQWQPVITMNYPCILYLRNTSVDAAKIQGIRFSFNKMATTGGLLGYEEAIVFDKVIGTLYIQPDDPAKTAAINFATIALKHSEQNV